MFHNILLWMEFSLWFTNTFIAFGPEIVETLISGNRCCAFATKSNRYIVIFICILKYLLIIVIIFWLCAVTCCCWDGNILHYSVDCSCCVNATYLSLVACCSDGSRENSRSSTDTASSVESSPCTGTTLQSAGFSKDDQSSQLLIVLSFCSAWN